MATHSITEVESALNDVRRSYRLLHVYQTRILDLVRYISKRMGLNFRSGWPWYTDNYQRGGKVDLENWAFDWLYMYLYEFNLLDQRDEQSRLACSVVIVPDTGFFDKELSWNDRNLVNSFNPVEKSQSRLLFMAGRNKWHPGPENMMHLFKKDATHYVDKGMYEVFLVKSYPLSSFMDATTTDENIDDFVSFCKEHGISELSFQ